METGISGRRTLYNIFAELCAYITAAPSSNYLVKYGCISLRERQRIEGRIERAAIHGMSSGKRFAPLENEDIDDVFLYKLNAFSSSLKIEDDKNCIIRLLQYLDEALEKILKDEAVRFENAETECRLNDNRSSTGIELLPRFNCVWARKSRQSYSHRRIDNYLRNLIVIDETMLREIKDRHIFIPKGFFKNFDRTKKIKISASPLSSAANFKTEFSERDDLQIFSLGYYKDQEEKYNALVWEKIKISGENDSEIVVFPEMLGNSSMEEYICKKLQKLSDEERRKIPPLIILPSYFVEQQNYSSIIDSFGNVMARQYKHNPYIMFQKNEEYMEDIVGESEIVIFHYEGIGRFAVFICKDFLTTRYMERIMRSLMLTLIIVPAYSTGAYDFKTSFDLCTHDYCNVVWINSCAAMAPGKEDNFRYIGYVRKRVGRYADESDGSYEMIPCKELFHGECDHNCIYYDQFGAV